MNEKEREKGRVRGIMRKNDKEREAIYRRARNEEKETGVRSIDDAVMLGHLRGGNGMC